MRRLFYIALGLGLCLLLGLRFYQPPNTVDDAYITFRYARNLIEGVGFVYNPGERVMGTTTPAYAFLLALLAQLSGFTDFPRLALYTNAFLDVVTFSLVIRLGTRLLASRWLALALGLLVALDGRLLDWSTGGMETSFNVCIIWFAWLLFFERRPTGAALVASFAVLIRPDGATLAATLGAVWAFAWWRKGGPFPWREAALMGVVLLPWVIFTLIYFGSPIPQSVAAKAIVYRLEPLVAARAFLVQLRTIFPFSLPPVQDGQSLPIQILQAILPLGLCGVGLYALSKREPNAWGLGMYIAMFIAFFSVGNPLWLGWYETPLMSLYWLLILAAMIYLTQHAPRLIQVGVLTGMISVLALPQLSRLNLLPWEKPANAPFVLNATFNKQREADYLLVGQMLTPAAQAKRLAANPEIGAFGYAYHGPIFDTTGLVSPAIAQYFPIPADIPIEIYSVPRQMIFDLRPELFVTFDSFIRATIPLDDPEFLALYRPEISLTSHAAFGLQRLVTYRRSDLPVEVTLPAGAQPAAITFNNHTLTLKGYTTRFWADVDFNYLELTVFWQGAMRPEPLDFLARVNLFNAHGEQVFQFLDYIGETNPETGGPVFSYKDWGPSMWYVDRYQLKRPIPEAGPYTVTVTLFSTDSDLPLPAEGAEGVTLPDNTWMLTNLQP